MTILHVTDFHFNLHWFDWLLHRAPAHDLVVMSGDMLDLTAATPHQRQIDWVTAWLNDFPRLISVCSGNHDLEWDDAAGRWTPAYWLRRIENPNVWTDGQRVALDGVSILNIGATTQPKGGAADVWVVHAAPSDTAVATRTTGAAAGDPDLVAAVARHAPRVILSGHVHQAIAWQQYRDGTLFLNPGYDREGPFPNHILVQPKSQRSELITAARSRERPPTRALPAPALPDHAVA